MPQETPCPNRDGSISSNIPPCSSRISPATNQALNRGRLVLWVIAHRVHVLLAHQSCADAGAFRLAPDDASSIEPAVVPAAIFPEPHLGSIAERNGVRD